MAKPTDQEIREFVRANIGNPSAIIAAMKQYGVTNEDLNRAGAWNIDGYQYYPTFAANGTQMGVAGDGQPMYSDEITALNRIKDGTIDEYDLTGKLVSQRKDTPGAVFANPDFAAFLGTALSMGGAGAGLGNLLGASGAWAPAVGGALIGGGTSALGGGNVLQGAITGGIGGYLGDTFKNYTGGAQIPEANMADWYPAGYDYSQLYGPVPNIPEANMADWYTGDPTAQLDAITGTSPTKILSDADWDKLINDTPTMSDLKTSGVDVSGSVPTGNPDDTISVTGSRIPNGGNTFTLPTPVLPTTPTERIPYHDPVYDPDGGQGKADPSKDKTTPSAITDPNVWLKLLPVIGSLFKNGGTGTNGVGGTGTIDQSQLTANRPAPYQRRQNPIPAGYRPGFDPEMQYFTGIGSTAQQPTTTGVTGMNKPSDDDIRTFFNANQNNPTAITQAMQQYNVDFSDLIRAMGWGASPTPATPVGPDISGTSAPPSKAAPSLPMQSVPQSVTANGVPAHGTMATGTLPPGAAASAGPSGAASGPQSGGIASVVSPTDSYRVKEADPRFWTTNQNVLQQTDPLAMAQAMNTFGGPTTPEAQEALNRLAPGSGMGLAMQRAQDQQAQNKWEVDNKAANIFNDPNYMAQAGTPNGYTPQQWADLMWRNGQFARDAEAAKAKETQAQPMPPEEYNPWK